MQKIVPHLWYDKEAKEAALFYISLFENSTLLNETVIENTPSGDSELVSFKLAGLEFMAISAGPYFNFNPSASLMVACESVEEVNTKWKALLEGGTEIMPLGEYPFSKWYGWVQDRFGLSWQLMLTDNAQTVQKITPNLLFSGESCGKAEEAVNYYKDIFKDSEMGFISRYGAGEAISSKAKVNYADFKLCGMHLSAMDNAYDVDFNFNEAFSLIVNCKDQKEIDYFWDKLSAKPDAEQCGWVKDQFGFSWQIAPDNMNEVMYKGSREENLRVMEALFKMKKIDVKALENARLEKR
ncbi:VOC family protein [Neobacillus kokaensis]|uniref:VOC family protein n=1 Tax=Neobacillus kokaensis TaxID=2759023 RepID=A0ABQ3N754_9BACI|nr:VOC family protein [Neobacillus kokaensis]GHH99886.1 VOC family protein [Neobacillus kokaensis]